MSDDGENSVVWMRLSMGVSVLKEVIENEIRDKKKNKERRSRIINISHTLDTIQSL